MNYLDQIKAQSDILNNLREALWVEERKLLELCDPSNASLSLCYQLLEIVPLGITRFQLVERIEELRKEANRC